MTRYINADDLAIKFRMLAEDPWNKDTGTTWANAYEECADDVDGFPTADVAEVKHGKWIDETFKPWGLVHHPYKCNQCGERSEFDSNYCPNCGARMERSEDE